MIKQVALSEVYWFQEGPGVRNWQFKDSGIKLLNVANITKQGKIDLDKTDRYLSKEEVDSKYQHFLIDEGDLVIASSGITNDADNLLRTKIAFIEKQHLPLCLNTSTIRFKAKEGISDLKFLKHWLNSLEFRQQITKEVTGIAQKNFGPSHLKKIKISLPPLSEQRRIASILDQADELRQKRQQAIEKLDQLLQATFIDMFGDPVSNPKGWEKVEVGKVTTCIVPGRDKPKSFTGSIPWITTDDLNSLGYTSQSKKRMGLTQTEIDDVRAKVIPFQSVVMSCVGNLGITSIANNEFVMNQQLHSYQCLEQITPEFLMFCLPFEKNYMFSRATSTTLPYMNKTVCNSVPVILPPIGLQEKWSKILLSIEEHKQSLYKQLDMQNQLFSALQNQAFNGTL